MGIIQCPFLDDYWALDSRVPQVADIMSSKHFQFLRRTIHFNNSQLHGNIDRFFKIRPIFTAITKTFQKKPETPKQSINEVMVSCKRKTAGNLRQYIPLKPDEWGFKLFSRASEDGFIHNIILYQGLMEVTLKAHGIPLNQEQKTLTDTSQVITVLASTMTSTCTTAIFADKYFTSLELVQYLRAWNCRYTGTAREACIGKPPLKSIPEMNKKGVLQGAYCHMTSDDGIQAVWWKDNNIVTILSTDIWVNPVTKCLRYSKETNKKEEVDCPSVIKFYNANMGDIDKSDMLVHLYCTPLKSIRWYMQLFTYCLDVCVCNTWLCYRRDCRALGEMKGLPMKDFRLEISKSLRSQNPAIQQRSRRWTESSLGASTSTFQLPRIVRGQRTSTPDASVCFNNSFSFSPLPDPADLQTLQPEGTHNSLKLGLHGL